MYQTNVNVLLTANTYYVRVLYNLRYQGNGSLSAENGGNCQKTNPLLKMLNGGFNMLLYLVHLCSYFDYVSAQEFGLVSGTANTEMTNKCSLVMSYCSKE